MKWINLDKTLPKIPIIYAEIEGAAGLYYPPDDYEVEIDGKLYDCSKGLIQIQPGDSKDEAATIAHEWRHHWQFYHGVQFYDWEWEPTDDYEQSIIDYFKCPYELDALRYELKIAPSDCTEGWADLLGIYIPKRKYLWK